MTGPLQVLASAVVAAHLAPVRLVMAVERGGAMFARRGEAIAPCGVLVTVRSRWPVSVIKSALRNSRTSASTRLFPSRR
jgi:hypothetical protein